MDDEHAMIIAGILLSRSRDLDYQDAAEEAFKIIDAVKNETRARVRRERVAEEQGFQ